MNHSGGISASFVKTHASGAHVNVEQLTAAGGGITVLFGPSGAGKTTVLKCLAGLERPEKGTIRFENEVWFDAGNATFVPPAKRRLGFVPQEYALFPHLSVERNVAFGLKGLPAPERRARVHETLRWVGLDALAGRMPRELSGGEQQRVALARAVARRPRLLLLDEPLSALDSPTRLRLRGELRRLLLQLDIPCLLVTHDRAEVLALGDDIAVMHSGAIVQQGSIQEVFGRPAGPDVAAIAGFETVQVGRVTKTADGLATVALGGQALTAVIGDLPADAVEVYVCIRAEDVILVKGAAPQSSPRNCLTGVVRRLAPEGFLVRAELDCGFPLLALLTKPACEELALRENDQVLALVKAPQVHLIHRVASK